MSMNTAELDIQCADEVYALEKSCFSKPWSKENILSEMEKDDSLFLGMTDGDRLIGYLSINTVLDEGYILNVAVDHEYRRKGVATELFKRLFEIAQEKDLSFITLEVRSCNTGAVSLYAKLGFEEVGRRKNYYSDPSDDALLMTKYLR